MAKSAKKASPKAAKKNTSKPAAKKVAKPVKKAAAKKTVAKKPTHKPAAKVAAKKTAAKKPIAKKVVAKKVETKKATPVVKQLKPVAKPAAPKVASKPAAIVTNPLKAAPSALNIFPNTPQQRPIAHRPMAAKPTSADNRTRYSDEELKEFETLINEKLDTAKNEYKILKDTLNRNNDEGTDATSGGNTKVLEDGAETAEKENMSQLAARQQKYITNLENALVRIKNGTYGICSVTGKLISKERLMAVPHTTQSIEAKMLKQD
jgi:RNA polymerase-binding transcription factor DksA